MVFYSKILTCGPLSPARRGRWAARVRREVRVEHPPFTLTPNSLQLRCVSFLYFIKHRRIWDSTNTGPHHFLKSVISCLKGACQGPIISPKIHLFTLTTTLWSWRACTSRQHRGVHEPFPVANIALGRTVPVKSWVEKQSWWCLGIMLPDRSCQFSMINKISAEIHL